MTLPELPPGWSWAWLDDVLESLRNGVSTKPDADETGVPVLRISAVRQNAVNLSERRFLRGAPQDYDSSLLKPGDVLFTRYNGNPDLVGVCGVVPDFTGTTVYPDKLIRARVDARLIKAEFLVAAMGVGASRAHIEDRSKTAAGQVGISGKDLRCAPVPVPPLPEQCRIVAKIEALQERSRAAREALEGIPPLLDRFRQSVLAAAFRGDLTADWRAANPDVEPASVLLEKIRVERRRWEDEQIRRGKKTKYVEPEPVDTAGLPELPEGWCWACADELTAPGRSIIYGIIKPGPDTPGGVPYVRVTEMRTGVIDMAALRRCHADRAAKFGRAVLRPGDVLISKDGTIGKVAIVPPELDGGNITQHVLRFSPSHHIASTWLARAIETPSCQNWMTRKAKGMGLQGVNVGDFRRMPLPLCTEVEQELIVKRLAQRFASIAIVESSLFRAFDSVMGIELATLAKAFRGELVPQDPNDEPASVLLDRIRAERSASAPKKQAPRKAPPPEPPRSRPSPPPPPSAPFVDLDLGQQLPMVVDALVGAGPLDLDAAVRHVADRLRDHGVAAFTRLRRGGRLYVAIEGVIQLGFRCGYFTRPRRGHVLAVARGAGE